MSTEKNIKTPVEVESLSPVYTLAVAAQLSGIPAHSIRQYIDRGLLIPYKLDSKRHLFSKSDISRLRHIHTLIQEGGLNFAGIRALMAMIPCWAIRPCSEIDRRSCNAYNAESFPCWEASEKGRICKNENCRECEVYNHLSEYGDFKSMIRALI
jgi:MerR family transcriptional regulator/heat shock protein HspR